MTRPEMDALIAAHDRWSAYDVVVLILLFTFGLALVFGSFVVLWAGSTGAAGLMVVPGVVLVMVALHREPYQPKAR